MKLDFRTKLLASVVIATVCISGNFEYSAPILSYFLSIAPFLLLIEQKKFGVCIKGIALILGSIALSEFFKDGQGFLALLALILSGILRRMLPGVMMGYYAVTTTRMSDVVWSLTRMNLPDEIIIPISVMFRFFYSLQQDISYINDGMKMYGITLKKCLKNPVKYFEFKVIPLFMVAIKTADDVAISAMTRGMIVGEKRTSISNAKLKFQDYVVMMLSVCIFILFVRGIYA